MPRVDPRRLGFRGGPAALLLAAIVVLVYPASLGQAGWVVISDQFPYIALAALLCGAVAGNGRLRRSRAAWLGGALGALVVVLSTAVASGEGALRPKLAALGANVNTWISQIASGEAGTDQTVFILFSGATVWAAAYVGAFVLHRYGRAWELIGLSAVCLVVNVSLALNPLFMHLIVFSVASLLLLVRLNSVLLAERWERRHLEPAGDMQWRVLRGGLTWTFVLVLLATATPRVGAAETLSRAWTVFEAPWQRVENEWQRFFAGVHGPSRIQGVSFSDVIRLGLAPNLGERIVLYYTSPEARYLRATAYDFYTGVGWKSTDERAVERIDALSVASRKRIDVIVEPVTPHGNLLFAPNEPIIASVPRVFQFGDDRSFSSQLRAKDRRHAEGRYLVQSAISIASKEQLRRAGVEYPAHIADRFLQLPSSLPQRVRDLGRRITAGRANPYDKAEAIEHFLRLNYRFSTVVKPPPAGRDPIDYFLYELREDFCEYFASAMVVMLRDQGVPARLIEGYTPGTFDPALQKYVVKETNAHAWVEVYFPGFGWVEFAPTPSEATFAREEGDPSALGEGEQGFRTQSPDLEERDILGLRRLETDIDVPLTDFYEEFGAPISGEAQPIDLLPLAYLLLALLVAFVAGVVRFELSFRGVPATEAAFGKMRALAGYLGLRQRPHQTSYEYARTLARVIPEAEEEVTSVAHAHVLARYAPQGATEDEVRRARRGLSAVQWRLLRLVPRRILMLLRSLR